MERIIICIVLLPLVLALVYTIMYPGESKLFRSRYRDDDDDDYSFETNSTVIKRNRIIGIIALAGVAAIYVLCILGW